MGVLNSQFPFVEAYFCYCCSAREEESRLRKTVLLTRKIRMQMVMMMLMMTTAMIMMMMNRQAWSNRRSLPMEEGNNGGKVRLLFRPTRSLKALMDILSRKQSLYRDILSFVRMSTLIVFIFQHFT